MEKESTTAKVLNAIAWGVFAIILGAGWLISSVYRVDTFIYVALGTGHTLIALNLARWLTGIKVSKFGSYLGLLVNASAVATLGLALPFIPTTPALVGVIVVAEAVQMAITKKTFQV